jgi:hypothetical protein
LEGFQRNEVPVICKPIKKVSIARALFQEWLFYYFWPAVEICLRKNNFAKKALLSVNSAPGHPEVLLEINDEVVKNIFLSLNTTFILQPWFRMLSLFQEIQP